ncbi:acetoin utilization deacetylase AcuC-like enzyme [Rhizobium aquaticum]|uniref:Acetoin utilization deacetylase AcuC-like enzyme n=1 Tax=Rhizobium aquaticum TaxID=1549636 RepID=A0ABV2J4V0_9HYPH
MKIFGYSAHGAHEAKRELIPGELLPVHDADYLSFLETVWNEWTKSYDGNLDGSASSGHTATARHACRAQPPYTLPGPTSASSPPSGHPATMRAGTWSAARAI